MTHLFEMGDKCLNYGGIWWQGWCHPPVFPGTSCKLATGHRTCRNAENVIGNDVASGMLPLAVGRQIPTKPVTFCWVGGSIPESTRRIKTNPVSIHWEIHECCASSGSRCETLNRLVYNSRRAVRETLTQINGGAEVQRSSGVFETAVQVVAVNKCSIARQITWICGTIDHLNQSADECECVFFSFRSVTSS